MRRAKASVVEQFNAPLRGMEFPFASTVTRRFPLDRANEALMTAASWQSARSVIVRG